MRMAKPIQIHLILIFIGSSWTEKYPRNDSNTSHINLYQEFCNNLLQMGEHSNTSHINLYQIFDNQNNRENHSNTSHINLYPITNGFQNTTVGNSNTSHINLYPTIYRLFLFPPCTIFLVFSRFSTFFTSLLLFLIISYIHPFFQQAMQFSRKFCFLRLVNLS